jgi:hypothetical protein
MVMPPVKSHTHAATVPPSRVTRIISPKAAAGSSEVEDELRQRTVEAPVGEGERLGGPDRTSRRTFARHWSTNGSDGSAAAT